MEPACWSLARPLLAAAAAAGTAPAATALLRPAGLLTPCMRPARGKCAAAGCPTAEAAVTSPPAGTSPAAADPPKTVPVEHNSWHKHQQANNTSGHCVQSCVYSLPRNMKGHAVAMLLLLLSCTATAATLHMAKPCTPLQGAPGNYEETNTSHHLPTCQSTCTHLLLLLLQAGHRHP
jgi:hypothetical protein